MSVTALGTVTVSLAVLGATLWSAQRINDYAERQPQKFNQIDLFLAANRSREAATSVADRLRAMPDVRRVRLVPKEKAWARLQVDEPHLTEAMPENPLPDKFEVEAFDARHVERVARAVRDKTRFPEVAQVNDARQELRTILGFERLIKVTGGAIAVGLFLATLFIVYNTIRLTVFARRREIRIMQLVGATPAFIRFPLMLEGLFHGVIGGVLASGILLLCAREVSAFVASLHSPLLGEVPASLQPRDVAFGMLGIGAFIGLSGSYFSVRRFLRQV